MKPFLFQESNGVTLLQERENAEGKDWRVILIQAGWSLNDRYYPADVLRKAVPLFEKLDACAYRFGQKFDHVPEDAAASHPGGFSRNLVGWFENARYEKFKTRDGKTGEGIVADFHVLEGQEWLRKNLRDAWSHGRGDLLGFSIDAKGLARNGTVGGRSGIIVERIDEIKETTVVTEPAAGGEVLRLVASVQGGSGMKRILESIKKHRPMWLEGFADPIDDDELKDYLVRVVEANIQRAEETQNGIPMDEVKAIAEVARGLKAMMMILDLLQGGDVEGAMKMLRTMIEEHPVPERGDESSRTRASYSLPYNETRRGDRQKAASVEDTDMNFQKWLESKGLKIEDLDDDKKAELQAEFDKETDLEEAGHLNKKKKKNKEEEREARLNKMENRLRVKEKVVDSGLPKKAQERVVSLLASNDALTDEQIDEAISSEKEYISSFSESGEFKDLGDSQGDSRSAAKVTQDQKQKWALAWDGYWAGGWQKAGEQAPFRSLKEAYNAICGRYFEPYAMAREIFRGIAAALPNSPDMPISEHSQMLRESWGGIHRRMGFREAITSSDFSVGFGDSLFRRLQKRYDEDPRQDYKMVVSGKENLTDMTNTFQVVRIGGISDLPVVAEGAPYQPITPEQTEQTESLTPSKKGGLKELTLEAVLADRLNIIKRIPEDLAGSAIRTLSKDVWGLIENNTVIQGNALLSTANGNLVATSPVLSYDSVTDAVQLIQDQTFQDSLEKIGLVAKWLFVGTKLRNEAWEITNSEAKVTSTEDGTVKNFLKAIGLDSHASLGLGRTASTDDHFWVTADPAKTEMIVVGFLGGRETPDIFVQSPADTPIAGTAFTADELTFKVRHVWAVALADWRGFAGSLQ